MTRKLEPFKKDLQDLWKIRPGGRSDEMDESCGSRECSEPVFRYFFD
jgi:hypothetical protein